MIALAVLLLWQAAAGAASPAWVSAPTENDLMRETPPQALEAEVSGRAVTQCKTNADGTLRDCAVVEETPAGWGFGDAALRLTPKFRVTPGPEGATVRIPLRFEVLGFVLLSCAVPPHGGVATDCRVKNESVRGRGLGQSALDVAARAVPPSSAVARARGGRFSWDLAVPVPVVPCPVVKGGPTCPSS